MSIRCTPLGIEHSLDTYYLPIESPSDAGEVYWGLRKIPEFIKLLPKSERAYFLSGMIKFCIENQRDRFLGDKSVSFPCASHKTASDIYEMLMRDFQILAKKPLSFSTQDWTYDVGIVRTSVTVHDEGIIELARVTKLDPTERILLLRCLGQDDYKAGSVRNPKFVQILVLELLLREPKTISEMSDELLVEESALEPILQYLSGMGSVIESTEGLYEFSFEEGDLFQFINDDQINEVMGTDF
jgi:hypothetical protein